MRNDDRRNPEDLEVATSQRVRAPKGRSVARLDLAQAAG